MSGMIASLAAAAVMLVSMVFMYFGSNAAIVWFFAMCPVLTAGILLCRSVINRYEDADAETGEPLPMFWRIRYGFHNLRVWIISRGLLRAVMTSVTCILLAVTLILGGICLISLYKKGGAENDPYYVRRVAVYDQCYDIWLRNRESETPNRLHQKASFAVMQDMLTKNSDNLTQIESNTERIETLTPWLIAGGVASAVSAAATVSYVLRSKKAKSGKNE